MKVQYIRNYNLFKEKDMTLALGFFDGVHIGHKEILNETIKLAKENNSLAGLLTFNESVIDFINNNEIENLTSINKKIEIAKEMNFDSIYIIELTDEFINMSKEEFISKFLVNMKHIVVGFDYTFGKNRSGDTNYLKEVLKDKVTIVNRIDRENNKVSTSLIKELLKSGNVNKANELLDREYEIEGYIHKRNKYYSISISDLLIPRNGEYEMELTRNNFNVSFIGKIKRKDEDKNLVIKPEQIDLNNYEFKKHELFILKFKRNTKEVVEN